MYLDDKAEFLIGGQWWRVEGKIVNLMEILRLYAERFCKLEHYMAATFDAINALKIAPSGGAQVAEMVSGLLTTLGEMKKECDAIGMVATRDLIGHTYSIWDRYKDTDVLARQCNEISGELQREFKRKICFVLPSSSQEKYESPLNGWEEIVAVFPEAQDDIEQMNRCLVFGLHSAAVFHALLVVEFGLIKLGRFLGSKDKKPGWDASSKALDRVLSSGRAAVPRRIRKHFTFLELVNKDMQSMKLAWRNKVSHAANNLFLLTSDFKSEVAEKIITASHGFMLLLATEGPNKK